MTDQELDRLLRADRLVFKTVMVLGAIVAVLMATGVIP